MAKKRLGNKAAVRKKLAAGAKQIRAAQDAQNKSGNQPATPPPVITLLPLDRDVKEIVKDRCQVLEGSIGLAIHEDTTLEESLAIFDWVGAMKDHVGFFMGDVLNFSETKFGEKYTLAMAQTGRANSTLKAYAETARRIPPDKRIPALSYSHHREVVRLENSEKRDQVLKEVAALAEKGKLPSTKELRYKVAKLQPPKPRRKPKRAPTSGKKAKGKGKKGKVITPFVPDKKQQAQIDAAEAAVQKASELISDKGLQAVLLKLDNNAKKVWSKSLKPYVVLQDLIDKHTGY